MTHEQAAYRHHPLDAEAPTVTDQQAELRDRIAEALAAADGWTWTPDFDRNLSPVWQGYLKRADVVMPVLPPAADRAAVLRDFLWRLEQSAGDAAAEKFLDDNPELRRLAAETQQQCPGVETVPNRCTCDCYGCKHHCGAHDPSNAAEAQQDAEPVIEPHCDGFPTTCPNPVTVPPAPPRHDGGIRCGCYDQEADRG
jgi:hypothetical protein